MRDRELEALRRELVTFDRGPGKRYPAAFRNRAAAWARAQKLEGEAVRRLSTELGVNRECLRKWLRKATASTTALVPVQVVAELPRSTMRGEYAVTSPSGFRIDGLSFDEALAALARLA